MKSPLTYMGGKNRLAKQIVKLFPEHTCYCEPFAGAAWVFFTKEPSKAEVINDLDGELVNFWRIIQNHFEPFLDFFKWAVTSRKIFELENRKDVQTLTDLQRAARYYYLQRLCFAGKPFGRTFGTGTTCPPRLNLSSMEEVLLNAHWRMEKVVIENLTAFKCIEKYDRPHTLFYIDPPYLGLSQDYVGGFMEEDFWRLRDQLHAIDGRFVMSINDCPAIRAMFKGFTIKEVSLTYSVGNARAVPGTRAEPRKELFILN